MLTPPGKPSTTHKRDSHSIPQERPGPPTCQTMLLRTQTSTSKPQLQSRKLLLMLPRLRPTQRRRRKPLNQLHHSSNSTEAETSPQREPKLRLNQSHLDLNHQAAQAPHHQLSLTIE